MSDERRTIRFSHNWNNKLSCRCFTTIRLKSDKYQVGELYNISLKSGVVQNHGMARILEIRSIRSHQVNEFMARIDSGLPRNKLLDVLYTMYKEKSIDWDTQELYFILLEKEDPSNNQKSLF